MAITFDDLPYAAGDAHPVPSANRRILAALARHRVPATGFVIQKRVEELGASGTQILNQWARQGIELGNHSWSHPDFNTLTVEQMKSEILHGEAGRKPRFFRFPFNHTGDTKEKHDAIAAFLAQRGYKTAPCTIDNSDWMFNTPYLLMLSHHDEAAAAKLRADYLAYTGTEIDYYSRLNKQALGYEPPHIMLLHDNRLNADVIEDVLALFESRQYRFVSLTEAKADPVYGAPRRSSRNSDGCGVIAGLPSAESKSTASSKPSRRNGFQSIEMRLQEITRRRLTNIPSNATPAVVSAHALSCPRSIRTPAITGAIICEIDVIDCVSPSTTPCSRLPACCVISEVTAGRSTPLPRIHGARERAVAPTV